MPRSKKKTKRTKSDVPQVQGVKAWSYSTYSDYEICPSKVFFAKIKGLRSPGNQYTERGTEVHTGIEDWLNGKVDDLPDDCWELQEYFDEVKAKDKLSAELALACNEQWEKRAWFDKDVWLRGKLDAVWKEGNVTVVADWKTGKIRPEPHGKQADLYALIYMMLHPRVKKLRVEFAYVDFNHITEADYTRKADLTRLLAEWRDRWTRLMTETEWLPTPGPLCNPWCHYRRSNGGPCRFG